MAYLTFVLVLLAGVTVAAHLNYLITLTRLELAALAAGLSLVAMVLLTLLGLAPIGIALVIVALFVLLLPVLLYRFYQAVAFKPSASRTAPAVLSGRIRASTSPVAQVLGLLLLSLVGGFFRFTYLGYSEFQGDEARAMSMAATLGKMHQVDILLTHKKGPIEVLLPVTAVRRGDRTEGTARLPFAVAGFAALFALWALGTRMWGARAGWIAAMLLAVDGFMIAFSRIVQYQSVVVFFSILAVWCAYRFYEGRAGSVAEVDSALDSSSRSDGAFLMLAALFLGLGSWAHYEMVFALPPVAWLVIARARRERWSVRVWWNRLAWPVALMAAITLAFYVPFVRNPHFAETATYIAERRIGGSVLYNMLGDFFARASFYNASYYMLFMATVLFIVMAMLLQRSLRRVLGSNRFRISDCLVAGWLIAVGALILRPAWFALGPEGPSLAILVFLPVAAVVILDLVRAVMSAPSDHLDAQRILAADDPNVPAVPLITALLWFAGPFFVACFLAQKPGTHAYTMVPAWALLVGWGLDRGLSWVSRSQERPVGATRRVVAARVAAGVVGAVLLAIFGWHQYVVFVRHTPEYKRVYPEAKLAGYWTPFGDELPRGSYFGFPYRAGWNSVAKLVAKGDISSGATYDSNEELLITDWYTRGAARTTDAPQYYFVAWRPQDAEKIPEEVIKRDYRLHWIVKVGGQEKLSVYERSVGSEDPSQSPVELEEWPR